MRRYTFRLTLITLAAAILCALFRRFELLTAFEESGLAKPWAPFTLILALVVAAYSVFLVLQSRRLRGRQAPETYESAFAYRTRTKLIVSILSCAALLIAALLCFMSSSTRDSFGELYVETEVAALGVLAVVAAVCCLALSFAAYRHEGHGGLPFCAIAPVIFYCFLLIVLYKNRAADPVIRDYVYELFATCASLLAFFFAAGFACGRPRPVRTMFFSQLGLFFSIITLADGHELWLNCIFLFSALWLLLTGYGLGKNIHSPAPAAAPPAEADVETLVDEIPIEEFLAARGYWFKESADEEALPTETETFTAESADTETELPEEITPTPEEE